MLKHKKYLFLLILLTAVIAIPISRVSAAATITVDSNNGGAIADDGSCTLREAIINANNDDQSGSVDCIAGNGIDTIVFSGAFSIALQTALPPITEQLTIDGYSGSPGGATANTAVSPAPFNGTLTIEIDGSAIPRQADPNLDPPGDCIDIDGANSTIIRGLVVNRCGNSGIRVFNSNTVLIEGSYIGTDTTGLIDQGNGRDYAVSCAGSGVLAEASNHLTVGGTSPAQRNIVAGNQCNDIYIQNEADNANPSENNTIQGNYIGTGANGTTALPTGYTEGTGNGLLFGNSHNDQIGGTATGTMNVFGSSDEYGVSFRDGCTGSVVEGNYIGTDYTGNATMSHALGTGNISAGIHIGTVTTGGFTRAPHDIRVGGTTSAARNIISGNTNVGGHVPGGILIDDGAYAITAQGNYVGTTQDGLTALANEGHGVEVSGSDNNFIGGTVSGARNVLSGNGYAGLALSASGTLAQGNYIGLNSAGTAVIANSGGPFSAAVIIDGDDNTLGGTTTGARNFISGGPVGVSVLGLTPFGGSSANNNIVQGNCIGTNGNCEVEAGFGNSSGGIRVVMDAQNTQIGGSTAGAGNIIAGNGNGVTNIQLFASAPLHTSILGNSIYSNTGGTTSTIGIDNLYSPDGSSYINQNVTTNDDNDIDYDGDNSGPNHYLNFPEITSVTSTNGQVTITYNLDINDAEAGATGYRVEFFANDVADPSGHGQGQTYLGSDSVAGDVTGRQATITLPAGVSGSKFISATNTMTDASDDGFGHTSEFSEIVGADLIAATVEEETPTTDEPLADTGLNQYWVYVLAGVLIASGSSFMIKRKFYSKTSK